MVAPNPQDHPNPRLPRVDPHSGAVTHAVVFLRPVHGQLTGLWRHPRVRIGQSNRQIEVGQGKRRAAVGIVRVGETVTIVNEDHDLHILLGRGADFFSLPFQEPHRPSRRRFDHPGIVELSSGAGYFWMSAHLFVVEHPHYAVSEADGRFCLKDVPAGDYDLVCWLPSWKVTRFQRHTESGLICGLEYEPPVELTKRITLSAGQVCDISFDWSLKDFP